MKHVGHDVYAKLINSKTDIEQYCALRSKCFQQDLSLQNFDGSIDEFDMESDVIGFYSNNEMIGGVRLVGGYNKLDSLPLEEDDMKISKLFPSLDKKQYCEISRLSIKSGFRTRINMKAIIKFIMEFAEARGYGYVFILAPISQLRFYNQMVSNLKYRGELIDFVNVPYKNIYKHLNGSINLSVVYTEEKIKSLCA